MITYDLFKIKINEKYRNLDSKINRNLRKFKNKSEQIMRLEMDIQNKMSNFSKDFDKHLENSFNDEATILSTCDTDRKWITKDKQVTDTNSYSKENKISLYNRSILKIKIEQKLFVRLGIEINEATKNIFKYYNDEIENLIKKKLKSFKKEVKPIHKNEKEEKESSFLSIFTTCVSREKEVKTDEKKEIRKKEEDDKSCLIY